MISPAIRSALEKAHASSAARNGRCATIKREHLEHILSRDKTVRDAYEALVSENDDLCAHVAALSALASSTVALRRIRACLVFAICVACGVVGHFIQF